MERLNAAAAGDIDALYALIRERLNAAAAAGDIDALYALILEDAHLLERIDKVPFVDTPLHIAASREHCTDFAMEMVTLMPSYATKLNQHGFSPMHLALNNGNTKLVLRLVDRDENLIRVKGRNGMTPLHYAAKEGNLLALAKFLVSCPQCIKDVTIQGETALHIALKENKDEAFKVLVGWIRRTIHKDARDFESLILNWRDNGDDSVLDIAVRNGQAEVVKMLLDSRLIDVHTKNLNDKSTLDIAKESDNLEIKKMFRLCAMSSFLFKVRTSSVTAHLQSKISLFDKIGIYVSRLIESISSDTRDALLVVFALVATATYEAVISPPGGLWQGQRDTYSPIPGIFQHVIDSQYRIKAAAAPPPASLGKVIMDAKSSSLIWSLTTFNLTITFILILILFPGGLRRILSIPLMLMYICYALSMSIVSATPEDGFSVLLTAFYVMGWIWSSTPMQRVKMIPPEWGSSNFF